MRWLVYSLCVNATGPTAEASGDDPDAVSDLTWLATRTADKLSATFNRVAREAGMTDLRDWLVLALTDEATPRSQSDIAAELAIDKSTLVVILDRLETDGLIERVVSPRDRRQRIPKATPKGSELKDRVTVDRERAIDDQLRAIPDAERRKFHQLLWQIAHGS
jgi:DNA-binding MarR family transcriptional regulator